MRAFISQILAKTILFEKKLDEKNFYLIIPSTPPASFFRPSINKNNICMNVCDNFSTNKIALKIIPCQQYQLALYSSFFLLLYYICAVFPSVVGVLRENR